VSSVNKIAKEDKFAISMYSFSLFFAIVSGAYAFLASKGKRGPLAIVQIQLQIFTNNSQFVVLLGITTVMNLLNLSFSLRSCGSGGTFGYPFSCSLPRVS
jgi:hypothetical protein